MQHSPYEQLLLFLYKMQCSGLSRLGGGGLESVNCGAVGREGWKVGHCGRDGQGGAKLGGHR